jgi:hypothetical protein
VTATGDNCCSYGDRIPGVWFYPNTRKLHVIDGHGGAAGANPVGNGGNDECSPDEELQVDQTYNIRIDMQAKYFTHPSSRLVSSHRFSSRLVSSRRVASRLISASWTCFQIRRGLFQR